MINRIIANLKADKLFIESNGLSLLTNWHGEVQTDNRLIQKGDIFVCIKGEKFDGHHFISNAIASGAALIVAEHEQKISSPYIIVTDTRKAAAIIAKAVILPLSLPYQIIGVTGTNGKTTTSLILYEALRNLGFKCGWIGTMGYYVGDEKFATHHTTPDIIQLNTILRKMVDEQVQYIVMEVSSHALSLDRVYGIEFAYCLFSNLSRDHLDFHGDMQSYGEAKYSLFDKGVGYGATAIINTDDVFGAEICQRLRMRQGICHSVGTDKAEFNISDVKVDVSQSCFTIKSEISELYVRSSLIGSFNIQNLALSAVTLIIMGFSVDQIESALQKVPPIKGRIQRVVCADGIYKTDEIYVFIDYAHTPDAIENLLKSVEELPHNRIICVFGAGGDRDKGKRPLMLKSALRHSDAVIITDDNPRYEAPDEIVRDIVRDCDDRLPWWIIRDRATAIISAIKLAESGDLVVICGKGHENYQEVEGIRHHFDDYEEAQKALCNRIDLSQKDDNELILPVDIIMLELLYGVHLPNIPGGHKQPRHFSYISTDSRSIKSGSIFFAIKGDKFDGHDFIDDVLSEPDNFVILEYCNPASVSPTSNIKVSDSAFSMGKLCQKYLQMFSLKRIALTGSTGKTTCKEMIAGILSDFQPCLKTHSNENNLIGLCKTILRVLPKHKYGVFELGTNHFGEIALLSDIVCPDIGIIINIGPSHLEFLKDEDGVFAEKSALFKRPLALRLYPGDDPRFEGLVNEIVGVGYSENCQYRITEQDCSVESQSFTLAGYRWLIPYAAKHLAINAAFAITLAMALGITQESIQNSLLKPINVDMRMQIEPRGSGTLIIDCYNANPYSMQKALEFWKSVLPEQPHIAILGDMLELGESSETYHQMIGAMLLEIDHSLLITVGKLSKLYHDPSDITPCNYASVESLISHLHDLDKPANYVLPQDSVVLLKASHGIHLERLIPYLKGMD